MQEPIKFEQVPQRPEVSPEVMEVTMGRLETIDAAVAAGEAVLPGEIDA